MSGKGLQSKIKDVQVCSEKLVDRANICSMQRQQQEEKSMQALTNLVSISTRKQDHGFATIATQNSHIWTALQSLPEILNKLKETLEASPYPALQATPSITYLVSEASFNNYQTSRSRSPSPSASLQQEQSRERLNDVLRDLNVDHDIDIASADTSDLLHIIHTLTTSSQDRAVALITSPAMQEWLTSTVSSCLQVNGQMFSNEAETRQSPFSYFCAKLVHSILPSGSKFRKLGKHTIFAVRWFCGQHSNSRNYGPGATDYDAHPLGMLSNLLAQLINQLLECPSLAPIDVFSVSKGDVSELCNLLIYIVQALPKASILFIVIDGISYYEDHDRLEECMEVLSTLTEITRGDARLSNECLIKLLVTTPLRSHHVRDLFEETEVLDLDEYIPPNGGFSALQWDMGIGRVIAEG